MQTKPYEGMVQIQACAPVITQGIGEGVVGAKNHITSHDGLNRSTFKLIEHAIASEESKLYGRFKSVIVLVGPLTTEHE